MKMLRLDRLLEFITSTQVLVIGLWLGLVALTIVLLVMMRTKWGQYHQLRKCLILSVLAHLLFVGYATTVQIVASVPATAEEYVQVNLSEQAWPNQALEEAGPAEETPWESFLHDTAVRPEPIQLARAEPEELGMFERRARSDQTVLPGDPLLDRLPMEDAARPDPKMLPAEPAWPNPTPTREAHQIEVPSAQRREAVRADVPVRRELERSARVDSAYLKPVRRGNAGLPTKLLERPAPVPRLRDVASRPEPEDALAGMADRVESGSQGEPADWTTTQTQPGSLADLDSGQGSGPAGDPVEDLVPAAMARGGGSDVAGGSDSDPIGTASKTIDSPLTPVGDPGNGNRQLPSTYQLRVAPNRDEVAETLGATAESERAVRMALKWMADNQAPDGNWISASHGGGEERLVAGRNRFQAGARADTGITGLALLAFLARGHTHQEGEHQSTVRHGLEYLIKKQAADGSLGGEATTYAYMYCHGMATFALSEACGMTQNSRLKEPVRRAIAYSLAAQNPTTGGWRYSPGDAGDTSQLGWQVMALKSAELAGVPFPVRARNGAIRFLNSVAHGRLGGLSAYRPGEKVSHAMTAEALACRHFLGMAHDHPAGYEAGDYLLEQLPGQGEFNLYYWYYGTLVMYQLQGDYWERWNQSLQDALISRQRQEEPLAGSWDPDSVWGGYGGRVYSTAMAALCLEVFYRFLPLYLEASGDREMRTVRR